MEPPYTIEQLRELIAPIAKKHGVRRVALVGSYSRNQATANSDVDLHIDKPITTTLYQLAAFKEDVENRLQLPIDLVTSDIRDQRFLEKIKPQEVTLYEQ